MSGLLALRGLSAGDVMKAYPVLSLSFPALEAGAWRSFAARLARMAPQRGGCRALQDPRGYVHACFAYRVVPDPELVRVLRVSHLAEGRLPGYPILGDLVEAIEATARECGCAAVEVDARAQRMLECETPAAAPELDRFGFAVVGASFLKRLTPMPPSPAGTPAERPHA